MRTTLAILVLAAAALPAQTTLWSPAQARTQEGNSNNTIPFWSLSSTYQQIHDHENMAATVGGTPTLLLGMALRKDGGISGAVPGRTMDVQMTVGVTSVSSTAPSTTFATNLGGSPTVVLPFTAINFPTLNHVSSPNPPGFIVPWTTPFTYVPAPGAHFCWEWRHRNASTNVNAVLDADSARSVSTGLEGTGCLTSGQSRPATIDLVVLDTTAQTYRTRLSYAAANAGAVLTFGGQRTNLSLPGQCAPLLLNPLVFLSGTTDGAGQWDQTFPTPPLAGPQIELLGQYAWLDAQQPLGIGLSNMSFARTAMGGTWFMCRVYAAPYQGGAGNELATVGSGQDLGYGLIVAFMAP